MSDNAAELNRRQSPQPAAPLLKICGLRRLDQAEAIAALGVDAIGVIGVASSPRFVPAPQRAELFAAVRHRSETCQRVLVMADPHDADLMELNPRQGHTLLQLHGQETPERCQELRQRCGCPVWKALRLRSPADLEQLQTYSASVDALLLDAWAPDQLGGTGQRIPIDWLQNLQTSLPWWMAGGITASRIPELLSRVSPYGLDVSSGVERAPGEKDLALVHQLVATVRGVAPNGGGGKGEDYTIPG